MFPFLYVLQKFYASDSFLLPQQLFLNSFQFFVFSPFLYEPYFLYYTYKNNSKIIQKKLEQNFEQSGGINMTKQELQDRLKKGPLILDGATGSNLMKAGMPKGICTEKWVADHPEILIKLQQDYVDAGSDIIYAPTFMANRVSLGEHGLADETENLNRALVSLSRQASGGRALIAGDLTTTGKLMEPLGPMSYETLYDAYREQISFLADAGVDLLVAETMLASNETMVILDAAASVCDLPVFCTLTIESDGSLFFGGNIFDAVEELEAMGAAAVGCNCSTGPDQLESVISGIASRVSIPVIAKPNAGMPTINETGEAVYHMGPEEFARHMKTLRQAGASILGGCCGTTPEFIRELKKALL